MKKIEELIGRHDLDELEVEWRGMTLLLRDLEYDSGEDLIVSIGGVEDEVAGRDLESSEISELMTEKGFHIAVVDQVFEWWGDVAFGIAQRTRYRASACMV